MKNKKQLIQTAVIVIVVLLIFVISFLYKKSPATYEAPNNNTITGEEEIVQTDPIANQFDGWNLYTSQNASPNGEFTFFYPKDLKVESNKNSGFTLYRIFGANQKVDLKVYPFNDEVFTKLNSDFLKEIDISDTTGIEHTEQMANTTFGIKGYQLNSEFTGPYFASLFKVGDLIFRVDAMGDSQALASDILLGLNFTDKNTKEE